MEYTFRISVEDVYGKKDIPRPKGYLITGEFRPPRTDEFFIASLTFEPMQANHNHSTGNARIILKKMGRESRWIEEALRFLESRGDIRCEVVDQLISEAKEMLNV